MLNENEVKDYIETAMRYLGEIGYEVVTYTYVIDRKKSSLDISFSIRINSITEAFNILNHPVPIRFHQSKNIVDIVSDIYGYFDEPNNYLQTMIGDTVLYTTRKYDFDTIDNIMYDFLDFVFTMPVYRVPGIRLPIIILDEMNRFMSDYDEKIKAIESKLVNACIEEMDGVAKEMRRM